MPTVLERLGPFAKRAAGDGRAVVVMVCNHGQSELLMNFVCRARANNISTEHVVLLFSTDIETHELAESIGMVSCFDEEVG